MQSVRDKSPVSYAIGDCEMQKSHKNCVRHLLENRVVCGPLLRFSNRHKDQWSGSILLVTRGKGFDTLPCESSIGDQYTLTAELIKKVNDLFEISRYDLNFQLSGWSKKIIYYIDEATYQFTLPARKEKVNFVYGSCIGFQYEKERQELGGIQTPCKKLLDQHKKTPFHYLILGGDQCYFDAVFNLPSLKKWLSIDTIYERNNHSFTDEMKKEVERYYFEEYCAHFHETYFRDLLASIPTIMNWDDHDIFDGYGTYQSLMQAKVVQGIFSIALRYYLLFQQHGRKEFIEASSLSFFQELSPKTAVLAVDTRSKRTKKQILPFSTWRTIFDFVRDKAEKYNHLIVLFSVPFFFPANDESEMLIDYLNKLNLTTHDFIKTVFGKAPLCDYLMTHFKEFEYTDDVGDQWCSKYHIPERNFVYRSLQEMNLRITFLGGDVHGMGMGVIQSDDNIPFKYDAKGMYQIISSPAGNKPIPEIIAKVLSFIGSSPAAFTEDTNAMLLEINNNGDRILGMRNWVLISEDVHDDDLNVFFLTEYDLHSIKKFAIRTLSPVEEYEGLAIRDVKSRRCVIS